MSRLRRWFLILIGATLGVAVVGSAIRVGLEQASWLAGIGSLLLALTTFGALQGGTTRRAPHLPSMRSPQRLHQIDASSTSSLDDALLRLRRDHSWSIDRRSAQPIKIVYWPIHLRPPTLIHAVQALAAANLSARGAEVIVCVEDLHEEAPGSLTKDLIGAIEGWFSTVPGASTSVRWESVRNFLDATRSSETDADPWRLAESYFRRTTVVEVLTESKIVKQPIGGRTASSLREANAYRLLTAPAVWSLMHYLLRDVDLGQIITLGGLDEEGMWRRWHSIQKGGLNHLYNPILLGAGHDSGQLRWRNVAELRQSFAKISNDLPAREGYLRWITANALLLPASMHGQGAVEVIGHSCSTWTEVEALLRSEPEPVVKEIAEQLACFYFANRH